MAPEPAARRQTGHPDAQTTTPLLDPTRGDDDNAAAALSGLRHRNALWQPTPPGAELPSVSASIDLRSSLLRGDPGLGPRNLEGVGLSGAVDATTPAPLFHATPRPGARRDSLVNDPLRRRRGEGLVGGEGSKTKHRTRASFRPGPSPPSPPSPCSGECREPAGERPSGRGGNPVGSRGRETL